MQYSQYKLLYDFTSILLPVKNDVLKQYMKCLAVNLKQGNVYCFLPKHQEVKEFQLLSFTLPFQLFHKLHFQMKYTRHSAVLFYNLKQSGHPQNGDFLYCKGFTSSLPNTSNTPAFMPNTCFIVTLVFPNCLSLFKAIANFLSLGFVCLY